MTEVAGFIPAGHQLAAVRHYEAGPPKDLVEPGETIATTKEEEWVSTKKTEVTNTKQIETRVKRQVVLEDGKVVDDSGPMVTTNTTEDTETQEHHQTELRKLGNDDENNKINKAIEDDKNQWVVTPNPDGIVREVKENRIVSREETEEIKEIEDIHHFGDITDEDYIAAVHSGKEDLREILKTKKNLITSNGPRVIRETTKNQKITDTENKREISSVLPDGKIITETEKITEHEELKDEELPENQPVKNFYKESTERYFKTKEQEDVDYLVDGVKIGHEMRFKTETMEAERRGDGLDETDFDSLSARIRKRNSRQPHRYRLENGISPLDRKDAITKKPLDFDQEEETRKVETSKWLEHHFGSDSKSSTNSLVDDEELPPKTSFFNVTIKSKIDESSSSVSPPKPYIVSNSKTPSPREQEKEKTYYKGISEWSERRQDAYNYKTSTPPHPRSPIPDYRGSPHDLQSTPKFESTPKSTTPPSPPRRKRSERRETDERCYRYRSEEPLEEPPPDYSPTQPTTHNERKAQQKTRFAPDPPKQKTGNIIGQSIRKLVGKIRSASAERKAKQKAKRSPSPSYQRGHVIDNNIGVQENRPVQRYYLGEDPFAGSIYGKENKYDGVKPALKNKKRDEENRSQSTLGRFSKSTSRLTNNNSLQDQRNSQTLPRHLSKYQTTQKLDKSPHSNSTINVSFINTVSRPTIRNEGPAKPARTYKSNLSRSKSLNVHSNDNTRRMYTSNPHLHRLDENPTTGLKSPGLISSLSRSQRDLNDNSCGRFARNGYGHNNINKNNSKHEKRVFVTTSPEPMLTKKDWNKNRCYDIYEPPTRLLKETVNNHQQPQSILRRGSTSSTDYSETYHTTSRNDNPLRPSVTDTIKSFSKKTIPSKDGKTIQTIESSETKSYTKSHYRGTSPKLKFYEDNINRYARPVIIEVRNNYNNRK